MTKTFSIANMNGLDSVLNSAIQSSFIGSTANISNVHFWATNNLKNNVEKAMNSWVAQNKASNVILGNTGPGDPPGKGFKVTFGLQIQLSYKVRFKTNLDFGYGFRKGSFAGTGSLHLSTYNGGLGVGVGRSNMVIDVTAAVNLTVGGGQDIPLQSYSLNYNSPIPMLNDYNYSLSYGQLVTWNSALNQNQFSLDKIQREGMIGLRVFDVNVSSNNDTKRIYFGGGTDMGWTGGISLSTPYIEVGFQDFSGDFEKKKTYYQREKILDDIKKVKKNSFLTKEDKEVQIRVLNRSLDELLIQNPYHKQTPYQKKLNKASTYIRFNRNGYNTTVDVIGAAWLQNFIHKKISDFKFEYDFKRIETWRGRQK